LELLASPWNADRVILAVVGTTPTGLEQASRTLTNATIRNQLRGNFVLVNGDSLSVADTRTGLGLASVSDTASVAAAAQPQVPAVSGTPVAASPLNVITSDTGWIPLVVGGLAIAIVLVLIIAALTRRRTIPN
jgi:hypothetical protein